VFKKSILALLWILNHAVWVYAYTFSDYPNQLHWAYQIGSFLIAAILLYRPSGRAFQELLILCLIYYGCFAIVSLWEVFPGTSFIWGKFELINIVVALNGFLFGRFTDWRKVLKIFAVVGVLGALYAALQIALQADVSRFGYGPETMLCVPAAAALGYSYLVAIILVVMAASLHKAPLIAAVTATGFIYLVKEKRDIRRGQSRFHLLKAATAVILGPCLLLVPLAFSKQIAETASRFVSQDVSVTIGNFTADGEGEDVMRRYINQSSFALLPQYWWKGMGFMNFYEWTSRDGVVGSQITRLGVEETGENLHNSYMTWILEGGPLVAIAVLVLFWRMGKRIKRLYIRAESKLVGQVCIAWCIALLLFGMFHQLHASVQLWGTIGIIFGMSDRFVNRQEALNL
jgi:hypothetical protein